MKPKSQQRNNDHIRNFFITSFFFIHATCCIKNYIRRNDFFFYLRSQCLSVLQTTSVSGFMAWWHSSFAAGIIWPASSVRMHSSSLVIKPPPHVLEHLRIPKLSYWSCSMKNLNKEKKKAVALLMKFQFDEIVQWILVIKRCIIYMFIPWTKADPSILPDMALRCTAGRE